MIGAGLGGLATALRLQAAGCEVTVLERAAAPGGRAGRIRDGGFTWDTGPSLITMPWVLEETFAAGGLDLASEVRMHRLDPLYRIRWASDARTFDFHADADALRGQVEAFSSRDARRVEGFLADLRPIYEQAILGAGRRPFGELRPFLSILPAMARLRAIEPLATFVARHFEHPRVREAFSFHSLFIGGDPFRVPAIYGALVYLQVLDGGWYTEGGVYSVVEALARRLHVRCDAEVERVLTRAGRVAGVRLRDGETVAADAVVSNADVLRTHALLGRPRPLRRLRPTMSCFLLYLGTDRRFASLRHHTLLVGDGYREFIRSVTRGRELPRTLSTYVHAPTRTETAMAPPGGDSLAILLPVPNLRADVDWSLEADRLRDHLVADLERSFGLTGLDGAIRVEHRMAPPDFRDRLGAVDGNAFAIEPTLQQSALLRPPNRVRGLAGMYHAGAGTHPGAGIPGVLLGAEITAGLVLEDGAPRARARAVMSRRASTFTLASRLLPREVRDDVRLLYLTLRTLDDLVDDRRPEAAARLSAVAAWAAGAPAPDTEEVVALRDLAGRHALPRDAVGEFCAGMLGDLRRVPLVSETDLDRYCFRVAGTVGIIMSSLLGADDAPAARAPAAALGMAMQRTNILRDLDEDLAAGRRYVPAETLIRHGSLAPGRRAALVREEIMRAEMLYAEGIAGIRHLRRGRRAVAAASAMYREILREVERREADDLAGRAVVSRPRRLAVAARSAALS